MYEIYMQQHQLLLTKDTTILLLPRLLYFVIEIYIQF